MERSQVTNGCSGSCCESFTLPATMNDLHKMKEEWDKINLHRENKVQYGHSSLQLITCESGHQMYPCNEDELDNLIDMLIPLGRTRIDPQFDQEFKVRCSHMKKEDGTWDTKKMQGWIYPEGEDLYSNIFTCRHFDKVNRVCGNYENRPIMCRNFGTTCEYKGCGFVETLKVLDEIRKEELAPLLKEPQTA